GSGSASAGDTATSTSTTAADSVTNLCRDAFGGTYQSDGLPCGSSKTLQQVTQTIGLDLTVAGSSLGHAVLSELDAAPSETRSFTNRDATASGTTCLSDGCVEAKQTRALGTTVLGGLPANVTAPSGGCISKVLVQITGYTDGLDA